jgi:hypothetical protein
LSDGDGVQPEEGQGAQTQQDSPWAQYLERIPEEARDAATEAFKDWDGNVTKRFQEAADFRKQMEPFAPLVTGRSAEEIEWGLQFRDAAANDPKAVKEWFEGYAQQHGLTEAETDQLEQDLLTDPDINQALQTQLGPLQQQVEAIQARFEQQDHAVRLQEAQTMITTQLDAEEKRLGDAFNREAIEGLAGKYIEADPNNAIQRAAQDWEQIYNQIQTGTLQKKVDTSRPAAETGGVANGAPEEIKSLARASEIALQQLRAERAT